MSLLETRSRLTIVPITLAAANAYVAHYHRHHPPAVAAKFSVGIMDDTGRIRGVATVNRPVSRALDDGWTAEVLRVCTDGCPGACSALYGAAWRTAKAMGYRRLITYTLATEPGTSLRAAGWVNDEETPGRSWNRPSRPRVDRHPLGKKHRWRIGSNPPYPPRPTWPAALNGPQLALELGE